MSSQPQTEATPVRKQKEASPKVFSILVILFGIIFLSAAPAAFSQYPPGNSLILAINTVWGLVIIAFGAFDYWKNTKKDPSLKYEYVLIIIGIITFFFYSHFYGTPWIQYGHLYIFPISAYGNPFYTPHWEARDMLSGTSYATGIMLILLAIGEIHAIKNFYKQNI